MYVPAVVAVMDWVVAPFDHKYVVPALEVNVTEPPAQKVVAPPAVMVGAAGAVPLVTVTGVEFAEEQDPLSKCTKYDPAVFTVIDCVVAPVDQILFVAEDEVKVTVPLGHNVTGPAGEIVGVPKEAETVTVITLDVRVGQPLTTFCTE